MGRQETCEIPHAPTGASCRNGTPADQMFQASRAPSGSEGALRRARTQEGRVGPATETIREQVRACGKS
jgi:hypothetical protein